MASEAARRYAAKLGVALPASLPAALPPPALLSVATVATFQNLVATEVATRKPAENCYLLDVVATVASVASDLENDRAAPKFDFQETNDFNVLVESLAVAMSRKPGVTVRDPEKAMEYFRASARNRLARIDDPMARGLVVGFETHRAAAGPVKT